MTSPNLQRREQIESLFADALEIPRHARDQWLDGRCGGDVELRREVKAMLGAHDRADGILDGDVRVAASWFGSEPPLDRQIGPYRMLREIGRGGMGVVYLGERSDGHFRQRVAIKLLRASPDAEDLHRRFLAERQILASLSHPNIAQLLDGGVTAGQLPYLVMEYVDGVPITAYCDQHRLTVDARLRLFLDVCAAVHHAHKNLVIHRDIKPGNILVTRDGHVKLLDFGIAKLLNPTLGGAPLHVTHTAHRPMTPEYASPEQVRGEALTTACDVYALGVVLYELLAGRRPYRLTGDSAHELARAVCEQEPERPSVRVLRSEPARPGEAADAATAPAAIAAARATSPERLSRRLRGDIDAIATMALRKEPARRYGSADLLRQDVQRDLDGLPVLAQRDSGAYRARKFLARHRVTVIAAAVGLLSVLGGAGAALRQAVVARRERDRADEARVQAESVTSFLVGLFDAMNRQQPYADAITADELVRRGARQAEALAGSPLTQARMLEAIGRVYLSMGRYADARAALERSLAVRTAQTGADDPDGATTMYYLADVLRQLGRYQEADAMSARALTIRTREFGERHPSVAEAMAQRGGIAAYLGKDSLVEALARRALDIRRETLGPAADAVAASLHQYAIALHRNGHSAEAETVLRNGIAEQRAARPTAGPEVANLELRLAEVVLESRGDSVEAERLTRSALTTLRASLGNNHAMVASAMEALAALLARRGDFVEAERLHRAGLRIMIDVLGVGHPSVAGYRLSLASVLASAGHHAEAEHLQREAVDVLERTLGPTHQAYTGALSDWAGELAALGRVDEAIEVQRRAIDLRRGVMAGSVLLALQEANLATFHAQKGEYAIADSLFADALAIHRGRGRPETHFDIRRLYAQMAERYAREGRTADAEAYRRKSQPR